MHHVIPSILMRMLVVRPLLWCKDQALFLLPYHSDIQHIKGTVKVILWFTFSQLLVALVCNGWWSLYLCLLPLLFSFPEQREMGLKLKRRTSLQPDAQQTEAHTWWTQQQPLIQTLTEPRGGAAAEIPQQSRIDFAKKRMAAADFLLFHLKTG